MEIKIIKPPWPQDPLLDPERPEGPESYLKNFIETEGGEQKTIIEKEDKKSKLLWLMNPLLDHRN